MTRDGNSIDQGGRAPATEVHNETAQSVESVCFLVAGSPMAIPIEQVSEAVEPPIITPMFHLPKWVRGLAPLRGDILLILDLANLIDLPSKMGPQTRVLVVRAGSQRWGVLVDEIVGVRRLTKTTTGARNMPGIPSWANGLFTDDREPILLLDMHGLAEHVGAMALPREQTSALSRGDNSD